MSDVDRGDEAPSVPAQEPSVVPAQEPSAASPAAVLAVPAAPPAAVPAVPAAPPEPPDPPAPMPGVPAVTGPADLRASDADRERYVEVLRQSYAEGRLQGDEYEERMDAAYRARTYAELAPLLADLPVPPGAVPGPPAPRPEAAVVVPGTAPVPVVPGGVVGQNSVVAVFGGAERGGVWTVPEEMTAFAMFGGVELDLCDAALAASSVTINAVAVFGGVEITVPEGVTCHVEGMGIFGGFSREGDGPGPPGSPTIRITGIAVFGGVDVKRGPKKRRRGKPSLPPGGSGGTPALPAG